MSTATEKILFDALKLPPIERAELIEELFTSFDSSMKNEYENEWTQEISDRISALSRGEMKTIPAEQVFQKINRLSQDGS